MFIWFTNNIPSLLSQNQEITNNAVAASKLSHPLCSIIEVSARRARKKEKKAEFRTQNTGYRIQIIHVRHTIYDIRNTKEVMEIFLDFS